MIEELADVSPEDFVAARDALAKVAYKMPFKCRFVARRPNV